MRGDYKGRYPSEVGVIVGSLRGRNVSDYESSHENGTKQESCFSRKLASDQVCHRDVGDRGRKLRK